LLQTWLKQHVGWQEYTTSLEPHWGHEMEIGESRMCKIMNYEFVIIYVYLSQRNNSTSEGLLPYIKMPTR
jgi:hypothetical protein